MLLSLRVCQAAPTRVRPWMVTMMSFSFANVMPLRTAQLLAESQESGPSDLPKRTERYWKHVLRSPSQLRRNQNEPECPPIQIIPLGYARSRTPSIARLSDALGDSFLKRPSNYRHVRCQRPYPRASCPSGEVRPWLRISILQSPTDRINLCWTCSLFRAPGFT